VRQRTKSEEASVVVDQKDDSGMTHVNGEARPFYDPAVRAVAQTAAKLRRADETLLDRVRERPLSSAALALVAGYVIGRLFSRMG
jgi:hypothetical protein